ncbi:MAG: hypothetical protein HY736_10875, partial [Verrucomicrobia bacterium]|nr:hypothetical protein [Verrucomicrobiota bacterium]
PIEEFEVKAEGNFYDSPSGILVHRFDAWDADAAGVHLHHPKTGEPIAAEVHRALSFDKRGWDRNYALKFLAGGAAAISLPALLRAMAQGKDKGIAVDVTEVIRV